MKRVLLCGVWFLSGLFQTLMAQNSEKPLRNVPYITGAGERQRLDLYFPKKSATLHPLVIWIHGGGWTQGSKDGCPAGALLAKGYAAASINYRLSQQATYPAQIEDCKAAIRWLRAHASEYGIDPRRFGVWGASAGAHLAALLGTTGTRKEFDVGENLDQPSDVQCVVDWFGPSDFLHWGKPARASLDSPDSLVARLIGGPVITHQEAAKRASPVLFVGKDTAPFLIMHGDQDAVVPVQQSIELNDALKKAGVETALKILPGVGHGGPAFSALDNLKMIDEFLDRHLTPAR